MKKFRQFLYLGGMLLLMAANTKDRLSNAKVAATQLSCQGLVWTHGEFLGNNGGFPVYTVIRENRIYISRNEGDDPNHNKVFPVPAILYHLDNGRFPISQYQNQIDNCINGADPSTSSTGYLGATTSEGIYCNGKLIRDDQYLGDYIGGDNVHTRQYTRIKDGLLRVNLWRQQAGSVRNPNSFNMALIEPALSGENGSFYNWNSLGYTLNLEEFRACFWQDDPKYGTPVNNNCGSGPTLQSTSNITNTSLTLGFAGSGVSSLKWRIKSGGTLVRSGDASVNNGNSANISYTSLVNGGYVLEIEGGNCNSAVSTLSFVINVPVGTVPCGSGPTITSLSNITQTALTFQFDGNNVPNIDWRIKQNGTVLRSGRTPQLTSSINNITYAALPYGTYVFEIEGGDCKSSVASRSMEIVNPSGSNNCPNGPSISSISSITASSLNVAFNGSGVNSLTWRIKSAGTVVASGQTGTLTANAASLAFSSLANGTYSLEIEGLNCSSTVSSMNFVVNEPVVTPNCGRGPTITAISNINPTTLRFQFDGDGVPNIDWRIKSGGNIIRSGRTPQLSSNLVDISYATLSNGTYILELQGGDCVSAVSSQSFNVFVDPCSTAPQISSITGVSDSQLNVTLNKNVAGTLNWVITKSGKPVGFGSSSVSGNSTTLKYNILAPGTYTLVVSVPGCEASSSSSNYNITSSSNRSACQTGPDLVSIMNTTSDMIQFNFYGQNVPSIDWKVIENKTGGQIVSQNRVYLQNDRPQVYHYQGLPDGAYLLEIQGGDCASTPKRQAFTLGAPLPIHITRFEGKSVAQGVSLAWNVVQEENGQGFEILRMNELTKEMSKIGYVELSDQAVGDYSFLDQNPVPGNNYYQLKQLDLDGSFIMSRIITVKNDALSEVTLAPNPASEVIRLKLFAKAAGTAKLETFNQAGIAVDVESTNLQAGQNEVDVNIAGLPEGHYFIRLTHEQGDSIHRFIKID
ncbi:T9SS type A sorting domain-containing protein [Dyadobacter tibetensis]|uniref:T9SS type A sorting domain-containing protein n=1 Tax=Dyadobacter tibetensis TaxID=1211851 RepID=UPI00047119E9|nr:T9SS type A sorting domain-containing protein [Dyadobacter tibetensis]